MNIFIELEKLRQDHVECNDCWYSCPKSENGCCNYSEGDDCNCGAEEHNNRLDNIINYCINYWNNNQTMSLHEIYPKAPWIFDIECFNEYGDGYFAQERFLVHGIDDVLWTSSLDDAANFIKESLKRVANKEIDLK